MKTHPQLDRVFPLSQGSSERLPIRPPRINVRPEMAPVSSFNTSAFLRAWAARRAQLARDRPDRIAAAALR